MPAIESPITQVPLLDLKAQYTSIEGEVFAALRSVCEAQRFILGPSVEELERKIAEYSGCRFGVGVSSGTDALLVALMAIDVGPGSEVITSPYTFFATGGAIARVGARPIFCDIDPATFNLSARAVERFIADWCDIRAGRLVNRSTKGQVHAIMPVHLFGQVADMDGVMQLARRYGLRVIEDAAQAIGSEDQHGQRAGSLGDIGCFSFFPSKNLGAFGDAGMCTTSDPDLAARLKLLRAHGAQPKYYHTVVGGNFRLDELQAAILLVKLKYLDEWTAARQKNAKFYDQAFRSAEIADRVSTPPTVSDCRHIYNQYVLRVSRRDTLREELNAAGIGTEIYYPVPLHMQQCFAELGYQAEDCPESARAAHESIAIPIYPELSEAQQQDVVDHIVQFYREAM